MSRLIAPHETARMSKGARRLLLAAVLLPLSGKGAGAENSRAYGNLLGAEHHGPVCRDRVPGASVGGTMLQGTATLSHGFPPPTSFSYPRRPKRRPTTRMQINGGRSDLAGFMVAIDQEATGRELRVNLPGSATGSPSPRFLAAGRNTSSPSARYRVRETSRSSRRPSGRHVGSEPGEKERRHELSFERYPPSTTVGERARHSVTAWLAGVSAQRSGCRGQGAALVFAEAGGHGRRSLFIHSAPDRISRVP
jgi:hypothetical protein